jgi:hypothetical protein
MSLQRFCTFQQSVRAGLHGLWFPAYMTTNLPVKSFCCRNASALHVVNTIIQGRRDHLDLSGIDALGCDASFINRSRAMIADARSKLLFSRRERNCPVKEFS